MLISKDQFCHFVNRLVHCHEEQEEFHEALRPFFDSPVCNYLDKAIEGLKELLVVVCECEDEDDIFTWWLNEVDTENRIIKVADTKTGEITDYDVLSVEGLYNYLYDMYHHGD